MKKEYSLSQDALMVVQGSSKGTQPKYYDKGYWFKVNQLGYEGYAEFLVSKVLECSNVKEFAQYEECIINSRLGCRSRNFLQDNESFISFQRLYEMYTGSNLTDHIRRFQEVRERIDFTVNFVEKYAGVNCRVYLSQILSLDMLTLNTDRHFNNLGIVMNKTDNSSRPAPVFDNGNSLLSDWNRFCEDSLEDNIYKVVGQPFAANLESQAYAAGIGLKLNYSKLMKELALLSQKTTGRGLMVLKYQLERYRKVIPEIGNEELSSK